MSRVAVCLFFIAIFHNGILFTQANETTTDGVQKNNEEVTAKSTKAAPATDNDTPPSAAEPTRRRETSDESKKDGNPVTNVLKGDPSEQAKVLFNLPRTILEPVKVVRATIGEMVSKGMETAKEFAGGSYNFIKSTVNGLF